MYGSEPERSYTVGSGMVAKTSPVSMLRISAHPGDGDLFTEGNPIEIQTISDRHNHPFCEAEVLIIDFESWAFLNEKILLDLCGFNSVVVA